MKDEDKTKEQLINELEELRQRVTDLETSETGHKKVEKALRESEEYYRRITGAVTDYIYTVRVKNGRPVETIHNPTSVAVTGYRPEEFAADENLWIRMVHEEDRAAVMEQARCILSGQPKPLEHRIVRKDGTICWVRNTPLPQYDSRGKLLSYDGLIRDITEHKRAEEQLIRLSSAVECSYNGIVLVDFNGTIIFANKSAEDMHAYKTGELIGKKVNILDKNPQLAAEIVIPQLKKTEKWSGESLAKRKDGSTFPIHITCSMVPGKDKKSIATMRIFYDLTEKKKAEEALQESEKRYRHIFQNARVSLWEEDLSEVRLAIDDLKAQGFKDFRRYVDEHPEFVLRAIKMIKVLDVNKATLKLYGARQKEELLGSLDKIATQESQAIFKEEIMAIAEGKRYIESEVIGRTLQGERLYLLIQINIPSEKAKFNNMLVSIMDITARKRAEEALAQEQHLLHALMDNVPDAIYFKDTESRFIRVNKAQADGLGLSDSTQALGKTDFDFWTEEYARPVYEQEQEIMRTGQILIIEEQKKPYLDGREGWVAATKIPLRDEQGRIIGTFSITRDITERKLEEENIRKIKESYERIIDNADEVIFRVDSKGGHVVHANPAAERLLGYSQEEWLNDPTLSFKIIHPDFKEKQRQIIEKINSSKKPMKNAVLGWITKDGREIIIEHTIVPITDKEGKIIYFESIGRDITARKQAEKRIRASLKEKEVLLQEIHHRVRNNMQVVSSLLKLQAGKMKDEKVRQAFKESQSRISAMALVHETLYKSKSMAEIELQKYIPALVDNVYKTFRIKQKVDLHVDIEDIKLSIDQATPLSLVINELISNSLQHAFPDGKGEIAINVRLRVDDEIEVIISDNGRGMPEDIDYDKTLGLQLVTGLVESQLGGTCDIKSEGGTRYTIRFKKKE